VNHYADYTVLAHCAELCSTLFVEDEKQA